MTKYENLCTLKSSTPSLLLPSNTSLKYSSLREPLAMSVICIALLLLYICEHPSGLTHLCSSCKALYYFIKHKELYNEYFLLLVVVIIIIIIIIITNNGPFNTFNNSYLFPYLSKEKINIYSWSSWNHFNQFWWS